MNTDSNNNFRSTIPALLILSALIIVALFSMPAMQMSLAAKKSDTAKDGSGDSQAKAKHSDEGGKPATANTPAHTSDSHSPTVTETAPTPKPPSGETPDGEHCAANADCRGPIPTPMTPPSGLTDTQKEDSVACDATDTICEDGQDHSHDGKLANGCMRFGDNITCNTTSTRTVVRTQVTQVPVAIPGLTSAEAASLSARIAQLQSLLSKPYGAECKSQIQTLLDVTQQALDAQNAFIANHLPTLQQGIPACYGSHAEQITETS